MKNLNYLSACVISLMLLFSSCSKEDDSSILVEENSKTATLSFGAVVNDLMSGKAALKQAMELPECSENAPATVEVILSLNGVNVVGDVGVPESINVNPTPYDYDSDGEDEYFTDESSELELEPGDYVLEYFQVLDGTGTVIWAAPIDTGTPGDYSGLVDAALPLDISLGAGVKKYVPIDVVCYDDRFVNLYGYLFFDIEGTEAIELCLFGNVCDENGRHAPANYRFDVWMYSGDAANPWGTALFDENDPYVNTIGVNNDGDDYAEPLCVFLPDSGGEDVYYGELYLIENGSSTLIREGQFTDADVTGLFDGESNTNYYHFREGCAGADSTPLFGEPGGGEGPEITADTQIYIYFDSSGSMNSTLAPLQEMRNTLLKDALLPLYDNDEDAYDEKVEVISRGTERTFDFLNIEGDTPDGNVISLVFQDEAVNVYTHSGPSWDENYPRTSTFESDITTLISRVNSFPANYYRGVIFQVATPGYPGATQFHDLITYVQNGTGNYSGNYGLSSRIEFGYVYEVNPGASAEYYRDLIVNALEDLGYDL
ncbi:hypothetical protein [Salinimicrobium marinum]|nr:hypothetical protein [Salinimicrobium marinum]